MEAHAQKVLTVEPGEWSDVAAGYIARALVHASPDEVRAQVEAGAALFYVRDAGQLIGCYVLRLDETAEGPEGVIVAAAGEHCGVDLVGKLLPYMEGQFAGVSRFRIHTSRPGMARKLMAQGYQPREMVFAKVLK